MFAKTFAFAATMSLSPAMSGDIAFITSQNGNAVSILDLGTHRIVAQTTIEGAPAPIAYNPQFARAYVIAADTGRLSVLDEAARVVAIKEMGEGAFGLALAPNGGVFVADWFGGHLTRLDGSLTTLWKVHTGKSPAGVAVSEDGQLVATADRDDDRISLFDAVSGRMIRKIKTGGEHPFGLIFHDGRLWTANVLSDSVSVINPVSGRLMGQIPTGSHPYGIAFAMGRGFVTNQYDGTLTVFDQTSLQIIAELPVGDYPEGVATLPDGSGVVVANWDFNTVSVIDAGKLTIRAEIEVPAGPRAFGHFTGRQVQP